MKQDVGERLETSHLELWRRAQTDGDLEAWAAFQQGLEETVLTWFHDHPGSQAACRLHSDRHFVATSFEQLWHIVVQREVACEMLSEVLVYLQASLNGAILETLRVSLRPGAVSTPGQLWKTVPTRARSGTGYKRGFPTNVSDAWPSYSISVDWNPSRLYEAHHRNGAMSTRSLVCSAAS